MRGPVRVLRADGPDAVRKRKFHEPVRGEGFFRSSKFKTSDDRDPSLVVDVNRIR